ncbi:UvrD/REP helicase [Ferroglobus placidus DSM 10642]|uniref:UvrD/REP helicase n=1 Tax=Ferroglobus placidus (strain DSM 10642 / AEDII12DO) TaxID=589924 RepID=D3S279_FERPA|nr:UvrD/REP helicase [Ferroglobus placidus]ADC66570.1 UvrD/REP helicase [Ferroglobus placidus DSM 10642]
MKLKFEKKFLKKLSKLPREDQVRILAKLKIFEETGRGDLVKLVGYDNIYRFRIGNYRLKMWIEGGECIVFDLEKREKAYK